MPKYVDVDGLNCSRAEWAGAALISFRMATGTENEELPEVVSDLLCDLMHLAYIEDLDFELLLERARGHYAAETGQVEDV